MRALTPVTVASCDRETFDEYVRPLFADDRMSVWYDVHGEGPAVVLVHAGIADSRLWEPQLDSFTQSHTVLRVDLPGFGTLAARDESRVSFRGAVR